MEALRKFLLKSVKTTCTTDLHKKRFLDRVGWNYLEHYELESEYDMDWSTALDDYILKVGTDQDIEITLDNLMESSLMNIIIEYKSRGLHLST